jgi:hypothetical protein
VTVSEKTVDRLMDEFKYTMKQTSLISERRNSLDVIDSRALYARNLLEILSRTDAVKLYYVDEAGFKVMMRARRGRSIQGSRTVHCVPGLRTRNISLCRVDE